MKDQVIPDSNYISRFIKKSALDENGEPTAAAFILRKGYDNYLSIDWVDWLNKKTRNEEIIALSMIYNSRFNNITNSGIAVINTGSVKNNVLTKSEDQRQLVIKHLSDNKTYSGIFNYLHSDIDIPEIIAQSVEETRII